MGVLYIHFEEYLPVEFGAIKVHAVVCVCVCKFWSAMENCKLNYCTQSVLSLFFASPQSAAQHKNMKINISTEILQFSTALNFT